MNRKPNKGLIVAVVLVGLFLVAPTLIVMVMSFSSGSTLKFPPEGLSIRWYESFIDSSQWTRSVWMSAKIAVSTVILGTGLGTLAALGFVRGRYLGRGIVTTIIVSPMVVPAIVIAVGMYMVYVRWGMQGTMWGMVAAHTSLAIPYVIVNVAASLQNFDRNLELAAQNLGAGPIRTFFRVTLPLIMPGVAAGALFAFMTSWDEVIVSSFLASPQVRTLPVVMWDAVRTLVDPTMAALATMLTVLTVVLLIGATVVRKVGMRKR
jgi:putative spermidine/putrescine transport system permease protein